MSQISQLEDEISKLRRERDEQARLVAQMREQVADYDVLIERLTAAFAKLKAGPRAAAAARRRME